MKYFLNLLFVGLLLSVFSCRSEEGGLQPTDSGNPPAPEPPPVVAGDEKYLNTDSDYIFDQNKLLTFELNLPSADLAKIDADPSAEEYVEGSLTFEGETIHKVGIRYKGSIGAFVGCLTGKDWANPSGSKTCTKLSMKVKINWTDSDFKFYGLKKLQFHSLNNDDSQMRERLGYWLFRSMGIPAPRAVHARLMINGKYSGLYCLVEQIDGRFTRYHFDDGKGNLYKEVWPLNSNGQVRSAQSYLKALKTNEDENPSVEMIQQFAQEIVNADTDDLKAVIAKWMDIEEIINYAVVDRVIRNDDGAFHWYCNGNSCNPHNYYWYEQNERQTMHLIPWDLDHAFENIISNVNPVTPIADDWGHISNDCQPFRFGIFGPRQRSATCDKLTKGWTLFTDEFQQTKQQFINGPFAETSVLAQLDAWEAQIKAATKEAQESHSDALSMNQWENALNTLKSQLEFARSK
jgi:hypothetical protein